MFNSPLICFRDHAVGVDEIVHAVQAGASIIVTCAGDLPNFSAPGTLQELCKAIAAETKGTRFVVLGDVAVRVDSVYRIDRRDDGVIVTINDGKQIVNLSARIDFEAALTAYRAAEGTKRKHLRVGGKPPAPEAAPDAPPVDEDGSDDVLDLVTGQ